MASLPLPPFPLLSRSLSPLIPAPPPFTYPILSPPTFPSPSLPPTLPPFPSSAILAPFPSSSSSVSRSPFLSPLPLSTFSSVLSLLPPLSHIRTMAPLPHLLLHFFLLLLSFFCCSMSHLIMLRATVPLLHLSLCTLHPLPYISLPLLLLCFLLPILFNSLSPCVCSFADATAAVGVMKLCGLLLLLLLLFFLSISCHGLWLHLESFIDVWSLL